MSNKIIIISHKERKVIIKNISVTYKSIQTKVSYQRQILNKSYSYSDCFKV